MKVAVTAPCLYPTTDPCHYLRDLAQHFAIPLRFHGVGHFFHNWRRMLLDHTLPFMKQLAAEGYSHVLYIDGRDVVFISGLDEIMFKYESAGSPRLLISGDTDAPPNEAHRFGGHGGWHFLNAGGYISEIPWWPEFMHSIADQGANADDGDYQNWIIRAWPIDEAKIDDRCEIFQSIDKAESFVIRSQRLINVETGSRPSILHFRGGYSDPITGRDARMRPYVEDLWH